MVTLFNERNPGIQKMQLHNKISVLSWQYKIKYRIDHVNQSSQAKFDTNGRYKRVIHQLD